MLTIPMIGWVAQARRRPREARELLDREVRRADRQRLAVVSRRRQRRAAGRRGSSPATIRTTPACPSTRRFQQGWVAAPGRDAGGRRRRRRALLHSRQRAQHLALDAPRRPSRPAPHDGRDPRQVLDYARADQGGGPRRAGRRPGGVGLERLLLQRLRPAVRQPARLELRCPTAPRTAAGLSAVAARRSCGSDAAGTGARLLDVFSVHYYPQGGRVRQRRLDGDAAAAQPLDALALGSELRGRDLDQRHGPARCRGSRTGSAAYYPGTQIGITEYNWGAEDHINGATAQADVLGIFGREGLDLGDALDDAGRRPRRPTRPSRSTATTTAPGPLSAT